MVINFRLFCIIYVAYVIVRLMLKTYQSARRKLPQPMFEQLLDSFCKYIYFLNTFNLIESAFWIFSRVAWTGMVTVRPAVKRTGLSEDPVGSCMTVVTLLTQLFWREIPLGAMLFTACCKCLRMSDILPFSKSFRTEKRYTKQGSAGSSLVSKNL